MNKTDFINKAKIKHQTNYDYSLLPEEIKSKEKIKIICPIHGEFSIRADMFLFGKGCQICSKQNLTKDEFIKRAQKTHGNKYNYSLVKYIDSFTKVKIICSEKDKNGIIHGIFEQQPNNHIHGQGCPKCSGNKKYTRKEFIKQAEKKHQTPDGTPKYDYSQTFFNNTKEFIIIKCKKCGNEFIQRADAHLHGSGCPYCCDNYPYTQETFIQAVKEKTTPIREQKRLPPYDYSQTIFKKSSEKINVICPLHGKFEQLAYNHLNGREGCQKCSLNGTSYLELEIRKFIESIIPNEKILYNVRNILPENKELDIYIPSKKVAIEFNGLYYHSKNEKGTKYHLWKTTNCEIQNIHLIQIYEDDWVYKSEIVKSRIKQILNITEKIIYARKCTIKIIENKIIEKDFLNNNHLQGFNNQSKIALGLYYDNQLLSIMTFSKIRYNKNYQENNYELLRFCSKLNYSVIGGASKLFKYFINNFNPQKIISYADRSWTIHDNSVYNKIGMKLIGTTPPNYYYIKNQKRLNRQQFQKHILVSKYNCPQEISEESFCEKYLKMQRIYDSGNFKYIYQNKII